MLPSEAMSLCRFVQACCPNQAIDELTPDAWAVILEPLSFDEAKDAAVILARRQRYIAPSDIYTQANSVRAENLRRIGTPTPPREFSDELYFEWLSTFREIAAQGVGREEAHRITNERMRPALARLEAFRGIES